MNFGVAVDSFTAIFWASSGEFWGGFLHFKSDFWGDSGLFYWDVLGKFR